MQSMVPSASSPFDSLSDLLQVRFDGAGSVGGLATAASDQSGGGIRGIRGLPVQQAV
jgi:hypothetical protein